MQWHWKVRKTLNCPDRFFLDIDQVLGFKTNYSDSWQSMRKRY